MSLLKHSHAQSRSGQLLREARSAAAQQRAERKAKAKEKALAKAPAKATASAAKAPAKAPESAAKPAAKTSAKPRAGGHNLDPKHSNRLSLPLSSTLNWDPYWLPDV